MFLSPGVCWSRSTCVTLVSLASSVAMSSSIVAEDVLVGKDTLEQCGIKCLVGCDLKNKTKMVCENLMHNRGYGGDIIHNT